MTVASSPISNPSFLKMMDSYLDWFNANNLNDCPPNFRSSVDDPLNHYCSPSFLHELLNSKSNHKGTPDYINLISPQKSIHVPQKLREKSHDISSDICSFLGAKYSAASIFYPIGGYVSWHTNWDCPGYAMIITYSNNGDGFFKYLDLGNNIVVIPDSVGWSVKTAFYGTEGNNEFWHCAGNNSAVRHTLGLSFSNEFMLKLAFDDLTESNSSLISSSLNRKKL